MRIKPYWAFAKKSFLNRSAYRFDHIMSIFNTCLKLFIYWGLYRVLYGGATEIDGITMTMVSTNYALSISLNAVFYTNDYYLPDKIYNGSIANELLLPISFQGRMLADNLGYALFSLVFHCAPVIIISALVMGIAAPAGFVAFIMFIISALLGYGVLWSMSYVTQMLAFSSINIWAVSTIKNVFINVLSGAMIPLWFMPEWIKGVLDFTPFSSIYFTPVQIYLGELTFDEMAVKAGIQLLWILVIYFAGRILWAKGKKKLVVQGG